MNRVTLLAPVVQGRLPSLRAALGAVSTAADGPFSKVPGTHYARWIIVDRFESPLLLFSAVTDAPTRPYLRSMLECLPAEGHAVWEHCAGWPRNGGVADKAGWLAARCHRPHLAFGTVEAPVTAIRAALETRRRLANFAVANQGLDPATIQKAFAAEFGS